MNKTVIHHSETISDIHRKSGAQNILRSILNGAVKILLAVMMWAILVASFFVL